MNNGGGQEFTTIAKPQFTAGLVDEYRDVTIELDSKDDGLITTR